MYEKVDRQYANVFNKNRNEVRKKVQKRKQNKKQGSMRKGDKQKVTRK